MARIAVFQGYVQVRMAAAVSEHPLVAPRPGGPGGVGGAHARSPVLHRRRGRHGNAAALPRTTRGATRRSRAFVDRRIYAAGRDFDFATLAAHPNVQVRVFNPFLSRGPLGISHLFEFLGDSARLNRRMHNKLWIADNATAVIGGRNLGDAYFDMGGESDLADLDVLAAGPVVVEVSRSFDEYWNSELAVPIDAFLSETPGNEQLDASLAKMAEKAERFRETEYARTLRATEVGRLVRDGRFPIVPAQATAIYDEPAKAQTETVEGQGSIPPVLRNMIEAAQQEVILVSGYFIPSERGIEVFGALVKRGVAWGCSPIRWRPRMSPSCMRDTRDIAAACSRTAWNCTSCVRARPDPAAST